MAALQVFFLFFFLCFTASAVSAQEKTAKLTPGAKTGECMVCHGDTNVPSGHVDTKGMNLSQCMNCHKDDTPPLAHIMPLSHTHYLSGMDCTGCHGEGAPSGTVKKEVCLGCHPVKDIVAATKGVKDANPHDSHYGPELDCDLCHHVHKKSENFCAQCHEFKFVVPSPIAKKQK